jgi:hypothetical protein
VSSLGRSLLQPLILDAILHDGHISTRAAEAFCLGLEAPKPRWGEVTNRNRFKALPAKQCEECGVTYKRKDREAWQYWSERRYCGHKCSSIAHQRQEKITRIVLIPGGASIVVKHQDGHRAAARNGAPGRCIYCEDVIGGPVTRRKRLICRSESCRRARDAAHKRDQRVG